MWQFPLTFQQDRRKNTSASLVPVPPLADIPTQPPVASVQVAGEIIPITVKMLSLLEAILGQQARKQASVPQEDFHPQAPPQAEVGNSRSINHQKEQEVTSRNQVMSSASPAAPAVASANPSSVNASTILPNGDQQPLFTMGQVEDLINKKLKEQRGTVIALFRERSSHTFIVILIVVRILKIVVARPKPE